MSTFDTDPPPPPGSSVSDPRECPGPCSRCRGLGYLTEDPMPGCPSVAYEGTARECPMCEGDGEAHVLS